jgi:hypothetical protein
MTKVRSPTPNETKVQRFRRGYDDAYSFRMEGLAIMIWPENIDVHYIAGFYQGKWVARYIQGLEDTTFNIAGHSASPSVRVARDAALEALLKDYPVNIDHLGVGSFKEADTYKDDTPANWRPGF